MTYLKYHEDNGHCERCKFEIWDKDEKRMVYCNAPAVGQMGAGTNKRPLCQEHYPYAKKLKPGHESFEFVHAK